MGHTWIYGFAVVFRPIPSECTDSIGKPMPVPGPMRPISHHLHLYRPLESERAIWQSLQPQGRVRWAELQRLCTNAPRARLHSAVCLTHTLFNARRICAFLDKNDHDVPGILVAGCCIQLKVMIRRHTIFAFGCHTLQRFS